MGETLDFLRDPKTIVVVAVGLVGLTDVPAKLMQRFGIRLGWARVSSIYIIAGIVLIVPSHFLSQCDQREHYRYLSFVFLVFAAMGLLPALFIHHQYSFDQRGLDGRSGTVRTIIGGRRLTARAKALKNLDPMLDDQGVFEKLGYQPDQMWIRALRYNMQLPYDILSTLGAACLGMAVLCGATWQVLDKRADQKRISLEITTPNKTSEMDVWSTLEISLDSSVSECQPPPSWDVADSSGEKRQSDLVGQKIPRSRTGIWYKPPDPIRQEITVRVSVSTEDPRDFKSILVRLHPSPSYVSRLKDQVSLPGSPDMRLEALVFNLENPGILSDEFAFRFGRCTLQNNIGIDAAVQKWFSDGLFNDFDTIIAVGAASRRHVHTTDDQERQRAGARAWVTAAAIESKLAGSGKTVLGLNIGRFQNEESALDSDTERQLVIVGIKGHYSREEVLAGLREAVTANKRGYQIFTKYKRWYPPEAWRLVDPGLPFEGADVWCTTTSHP